MFFREGLLAVLLLVQIGGCSKHKQDFVVESKQRGLNYEKSTVEPQAAATPERVSKNALVKRDGWQLPDIASFVVNEPRRPASIDGERIFRTEYLPKEQIIISATRPQLMEAGSSHIEKWAVSSMIKFESSNGYSFCYMTRSVKMATDENGNVLGKVSTAVSINFYDDNGDGVFETLEFGSPVNGASPTIPSWVSNE